VQDAPATISALRAGLPGVQDGLAELRHRFRCSGDLLMFVLLIEME